MSRLDGRVVATTRDGSSDDELVVRLELEGARVLVWPTLSFEEGPNEELEAATRALAAYDWVVLTSEHAVRPLTEAAAEPPPGVRVAAVGPGTAAAVTAAGWPLTLTGDGGARELVAAMARSSPVAGAVLRSSPLAGSRVLFPAGSLARPTLEAELRAHGAEVHRVEAYRTVIESPDAERVRADLAVGVDVVAFASPSAVRALAEALAADWPRALERCGVAAIGPTTARALEQSGVARVRTARSPRFGDLVEACVKETAGRTAARPIIGARS